MIISRKKNALTNAQLPTITQKSNTTINHEKILDILKYDNSLEMNCTTHSEHCYFKYAMYNITTQGVNGFLFDLIEKALLDLTINHSESPSVNMTKIINYTKTILKEEQYICGPYNLLRKNNIKLINSVQEETHKLKSALAMLMQSNGTFGKTYLNQIKIHNELVKIENTTNGTLIERLVDKIEYHYFESSSVAVSTMEREFFLNVEFYIKNIKFSCYNDRMKTSVFFDDINKYGNNTYRHKAGNNTQVRYSDENHDHKDNYINGGGKQKSNITNNTWGSRDWCDPKQCSGCCVNGKCLREEECANLMVTGSLVVILLMFAFACCCCVCIVWAIVYLVLRLNRRTGNSQLQNGALLVSSVNGFPLNVNNTPPIENYARIDTSSSNLIRGNGTERNQINH